MKKGDYDRAIDDLNMAIDLKPDCIAYSNRGIAYDKKGDYDRAIEDFTKVIDLKPDYAEAYNSRGGTYGKKGDVDRAIADFNKAIDLKSQICWSLLQSRYYLHHKRRL